MDFKSKIEGFATHQIISLILDLLGKVSDENLIRLTYLGEMLTSDEKVLSDLDGLRRLLKTPHHPAKRLFRRKGPGVRGLGSGLNIEIRFHPSYYRWGDEGMG